MRQSASRKSGIPVRYVSFALLFVLCAALIISQLLPGITVVSAASSEFDIFRRDEYSRKTTQSIVENSQVEVQFRITSAISKFGMQINDHCKNREIKILVYKWDKNARNSQEGTPLYERNVTEWLKNETVFADFGSNGLEAGEYLFVMRVVKSDSPVNITWILPAILGIRCYINGLETYGGPLGSCVAKDPCDKIFDLVSDQEDFEFNTAPPESVIEDDSQIAILGVDPTTWNFEDGLGRTGSDYTEVGAKNDKKVGIFYWTWHLHNDGPKACNVNSIMEKYPEARNDYNHYIWQEIGSAHFFWNEPVFDYYTLHDEYVLRKHAEMLADAGIDFVMFDCTNGNYTWEEMYMNLLRVWSEARADGVKTPQVAFMLQFTFTENTLDSLTQIYNMIYREGLYSDLWFYWEGKPLVMGYDTDLDRSIPLEAEIANFFTFKRNIPSYFEDSRDDSYWGWLHIYPQALYKNADGTVEMTTVGVAQNANIDTMSCDAMNNPHNMGRSYSRQPDYYYTYTYRGEKIVCNSQMENSKLYGINFQEQWDYAIAQDPEIIFITGWNEWTAGRYDHWGSVDNAFPDECDDENSRDVEPSKGDLLDHYYYQMVENIRRFKGASPQPAQKFTKTVDINGDFSEWNDDRFVSYNHYANNTYERNAQGYGRVKYKNEAIRNDFVTAKVAYDDQNIYFYVKTINDITPYDSGSWMRLLIDAGEATKDSTDFEGFEYIIGRETGTGSTLSLEKSTGGWAFEKICDVKYTVRGNEMAVEVPRESLGMTSKDLLFGFKWADANLEKGDILSLYTDGDTAPSGRFTYVFRTTAMKTEKKGCGGHVTGICVALITLVTALVYITVRIIESKKAGCR